MVFFVMTVYMIYLCFVFVSFFLHCGDLKHQHITPVDTLQICCFPHPCSSSTLRCFAALQVVRRRRTPTAPRPFAWTRLLRRQGESRLLLVVGSFWWGGGRFGGRIILNYIVFYFLFKLAMYWLLELFVFFVLFFSKTKPAFHDFVKGDLFLILE